MGVSLHWAPIDGALTIVGSRQSAINTAWRGVPEADRTPVRRRLIIALVDHIREHHERTGQLAPTDLTASAPDRAADVASTTPPTRSDGEA